MHAARRGISPIWVVPIAALIASAWLVYQAVIRHGPTILIHFENAEGIEAGKTRLKYLSVDLGKVTRIHFAATGTGVEVEAELAPGTESRLTETTRFWVVRPRLEATGVSGLGTLFSGAFIGMDPGEGGKARRKFRALEDPPRILSHQSGSIFSLWSPDLHSLSIGSPVYFRRIQVGSVVGYELSEDHTQVLIEIFVESPHDTFVDPGSRFWSVSGLQVEASAQGIQVDLESLVSLATGGIAFDVPESPGSARPVPEGHLFPLHRNRRQSEQQAVVGTYPFLIHFNESVRGLNRDAAVEFRGLQVGTVREILPARSIGPGEVRIGVLIGLDPGLLPYSTDSELTIGWERRLEWVGRLAASGARAQLKTGNLLTGQKYVDIDVYPNAAPVEVVADMGYPVIPSISGSLQGITDSVASILSRLESVDIAAIGRNINAAARGASELANDAGLRETLAHLNASSRQLDTLLATVNGRAGPVLDNATRASADLSILVRDASAAMRQMEATLQSLEASTSADGRMGNEVMKAMRELSAAARAIRAMAEYLERHPEALISGKK